MQIFSDSVWQEVLDRRHDQMMAEVRAEVRNEVRDEVKDEVKNKVEDELKKRNGFENAEKQDSSFANRSLYGVFARRDRRIEKESLNKNKSLSFDKFPFSRHPK